jgi:hypothetical protein
MNFKQGFGIYLIKANNSVQTQEYGMVVPANVQIMDTIFREDAIISHQTIC